MNRLRIIAALLSLHALAGCRSSAPAPVVVTPPDLTVETICSRPLERLGTTRASVKAVLGAPVSISETEVPNRHTPGVTDRRVVLHHNGSEITLHEVPQYERSFLALVSMTSADHRIDYPLRIGSSLKDMQLPSSIRQTALTNSVRLECPGEMPPTILLQLTGGKISRIDWINEPD